MSMRTALRSSNPALGAKSFGGFVAGDGAAATVGAGRGVMTIQGTVDKTAILLAVATIAALWPWRLFFRTGDPELLFPWLAAGSIGGFVVALSTIFKKSWAPVTAPLYAAFEGVALGSISALFEVRYPGIVLRSMALTFATLGVMLVAFRTKAIPPTERFKLGVVAATGAIALVYLASAVMSLFGVHVGLWQSTGAVGIAISLVVVVVAALNLVLDFDMVQQGAAQGAPKYMEWYGAFGLLVTLVWLYMEVLRLLAKVRDNR
jgi:uncharacterized YccA/Bax inhibitor family protein